MRKFSFTIILFCSAIFSFNALAKADPDQEFREHKSLVIDRIGNHDIEVTIPSILFTFRNVEIKLKFKNAQHPKLLSNKNKIDFIINGEEKELVFVNGEASFIHRFDKNQTLSIYTEDFNYVKTVRPCPLWAILLPLIGITIWVIARLMKKKV